jgi:hypothetical protein
VGRRKVNGRRYVYLTAVIPTVEIAQRRRLLNPKYKAVAMASKTRGRRE